LNFITINLFKTITDNFLRNALNLIFTH